jgi:hypothetical protein
VVRGDDTKANRAHTYKIGLLRRICGREKSCSIDEASYGPAHLNIALRLNNLAGLLSITNRLADAEAMTRRMLAILLQSARATGPQHLTLSQATNNYAKILSAMGLGPEEVRNRLNAVSRPFGVSLGG